MQTSEASELIHNVAATTTDAGANILAAAESESSSTASVHYQLQHEQDVSDSENDVHVRDDHNNECVSAVTTSTTNLQRQQQQHDDESEHDLAADGNDHDYANGDNGNEFDQCGRNESPRVDDSNRMSVGSSSSSSRSSSARRVGMLDRDDGNYDDDDDNRSKHDYDDGDQECCVVGKERVSAAAGGSQQQQNSSSSSSSARRRGGVARVAIGQDGYPPWYLVDRKPCEWDGYRDTDNDDGNFPFSRMERNDGYEIKKNAVKNVKALAKRLKAIKEIEDQLSFLNVFIFFQDIFQGNHRVSQHNASDAKKKGYIVSNPMSSSKPWGRHQGKVARMILVDSRVAVSLS